MVGTSNPRRKKIIEKQLQLRKTLWPDLDESFLWIRTEKDGFTTIPRTIPIILWMMNSLSKNKPVSSTYLELWCRAFDQCIVRLSNHQEHAFHAGFTGQRSVPTWKERIRILVELGFIDVKPGPSGEISYALIFNPYNVIKRHHEERHPGITEDMFNALSARAVEIGAKDLEKS